MLLAEESSGEAAAALQSLYAGSDPGLDLTVVSTIATLLPTIKVVDPEVILLDLTLSLREPMDAVHLVHRTAPGVPLIVAVDPSQKEQAVRSLAEGAMDYVLKGHIDAHALERVLRTALERNTLTGLTDLLRDRVTGLYTRDGFLTVGSRRQEEAIRAGNSLVLICVLFENLQALRDAFGPGTADRALCDVAALLKGCCRRSDVVGRLGEAQFAILGVGAVAPSAAVMPGTISKSTLALRSASISSPARPKISGSPPLRRRTTSCLAAADTSSELISSCVSNLCPQRLPTSITSASRFTSRRISSLTSES